MRISDWISDVCSSDLGPLIILAQCLQRFNAAVMVAVQLDVQHLIKAKALSTPVLHQFINTGTSAIPALPRRGCKAALVRPYNHAAVRKPLVPLSAYNLVPADSTSRITLFHLSTCELSF